MRAAAAELLEIARLDSAEVRAWRGLSERAEQPNPFFDPDFVGAAGEHLEGSARHLAVVRTDSHWHAAFPVREIGVRPFSVLITCNHLYCFAGVPLLEVDAPDWVLARMFRRGVLLRKLTEGPVSAAIDRWSSRYGIRYVFSEDRRAALKRRPQPDYVSAHLSGRRVKEYRRQRRRLAERLGGELTLVDRSRDPAAVRRFVELEASGWKGGNGTAIASRSGDQQCFQRICADLGSRDELQLLSLEGGGETVAMQVNLVAGETLFSFKVAFDERWAKYSPGALLELDAVDAFHRDRRLGTADSCADPGSSLIDRLWPDRISVRSVYVGPRTLRGRLHRWALRIVRRARRGRHDGAQHEEESR